MPRIRLWRSMPVDRVLGEFRAGRTRRMAVVSWDAEAVRVSLMPASPGGAIGRGPDLVAKWREVAGFQRLRNPGWPVKERIAVRTLDQTFELQVWRSGGARISSVLAAHNVPELATVVVDDGCVRRKGPYDPLLAATLVLGTVAIGALAATVSSYFLLLSILYVVGVPRLPWFRKHVRPS